MKKKYDRDTPPGESKEPGLVRYQRGSKKASKNADNEVHEAELVVPERPPISLALRPTPGQADQDPVAVYLSRLAPGSRPTMKQSLKVVAKMLDATPSTLPWHKLRYQHTQAIRARLAEKYAPNTANKILAAMRGVLHEAKKLGYMSVEDYDKAVDLDPVQGKRTQKGRALSDAEIGKIFASMDPGLLTGARDSALVAMLYGAGLRRAEVTELKIGSYNREEETIHVRGKGNKERIVYLDDGVIRAVDNWLKLREGSKKTDFLFVPVDKWGNIYDRKLSEQSVMLRMDSIAAKAHVKRFAPHDMRRTFASGLLDRDVDIRTVQQLLGHSNVETTAKYDRRGEKTKKEAVKKLSVPFVSPQ